MQRMSYVASQMMMILLVVGIACVWAYEPGRQRMYDFGLGKRSYEDPSSYEDFSAPNNEDSYSVMDKKAKSYSFGLGKRARNYGFGLGKRLEAWKSNPSALLQAYRPERRSKIYSFGLGKRSSSGGDLEETYSELFPNSDKRTLNGGRQFSFGLGKREAVAETHNATS